MPTLGIFLSNHGTRHQTSCTYAPKQNGLTEKKNRQILEVVRTSLFGMNMQQFYWEEAMKSTCYLTYQTPHRVINFKLH